MKNVLWLAGWYPNRLEPLAGDFIERHAKAVSLLHSISVIHVIKDNLNDTNTKIVKEKRIYDNNNSEATIIYYKAVFQHIKWLSRVFSSINYLKYFIREARIYISRNGKPDLIHVHIAQKAGLVALWLKWYYKIPYIVSEQWTGFCYGARPGFDDQNRVARFLWKVIMKNASGCSTVSDYLGTAMKSRSNKLDYVVIPNVVDTSLFNYQQHPASEVFRFIHISTLRYQKNPEQIFEAIKTLSVLTKRPFELLIYGPHKPELLRLANQLNIPSFLKFKNEISQQQLAKDMQQAHSLILYSRYETFGCVIVEANACGLPVIVSDLAVLRENVTENVTGIFVPLHNPGRLANALLWMMENRSSFCDEDIAEITCKKYSFRAIAEQFDRLYHKVLSSQT